MKKNIIILSVAALSVLFAIDASAQNNLGKTDDVGRIVLSPYVVSNANVPSYAEKALNNKLTSIAAAQGVAGASVDQRFVITASLVEMGKEFTATAPPKIALTVYPTIYIGDSYTGELFSSCDLPPVKGVGDNDTKAYLAAVKGINANSKEVVQCINKGKEKIVEYYNSKIDFLLAEAEAMASAQQFDEAMARLAEVPEVCKDAYLKAYAKIGEVYQKKIDLECDKLYNEAYAQWNTSKTKESAEKVVELLAQINPISSAAAKGRKLVASVEAYYSELEARRRAIEERNWEFKMRQYEDKQANLVAEREIAHTENMAGMNYDYEVQMEHAKNGAAASEYALQEVKGIVEMMSRSGKSFGESVSNSSIVAKITSWFK